MAKPELVTREKQQEAARKQEQESRKLTRDEIAKRVREIRKELEAAKERYEGALFDNYTGGIPRSLDVVDVNREPYGAVQYISPWTEGCLERLQNGIVNDNDPDDVFEFFFFRTETAFQLGMLAGAIYADCPTTTIDRFERGLVTALSACHWIIVKEQLL